MNTWSKGPLSQSSGQTENAKGSSSTRSVDGRFWLVWDRAWSARKLGMRKTRWRTESTRGRSWSETQAESTVGSILSGAIPSQKSWLGNASNFWLCAKGTANQAAGKIREEAKGRRTMQNLQMRESRRHWRLGEKDIRQQSRPQRWKWRKLVKC